MDEKNKKNGICAILNFGANIPKGLEPPSLSLSSTQLDPVSISAGLGLGGINLNVSKDLSGDSWGYQCGLGISGNSINISPGI